MSQLTVYAEADGKNPLLATEDVDLICTELGAAGIHLERWKADRDLADDADNETIIAAYRVEIDRLVAERGRRTRFPDLRRRQHEPGSSGKGNLPE